MARTSTQQFSIDWDTHARITVLSDDGFDETVVAIVDVENAVTDDERLYLQLGSLNHASWRKEFGTVAELREFVERHLPTLAAITGEFGEGKLPASVRDRLSSLD